MAGRGFPPKAPEERRNPRDRPRHEWRQLEVSGWQHGDIPPVPPKLLPASRKAWSVWMGSWFASHWGPEDLPALRQVIRLFDQVERGEFQRHAELRLAMDGYGLTPKGRQERRWLPPMAEPKDGQAARYGRLRAVPE